MDKMVRIFAYDVQRAADRRRVAAVLEARATRVQQSLFEAYLGDAEADRLFDAARALLGPGDSLRVYALSSTGRERSRHVGGPPISEDGEYWLL